MRHHFHRVVLRDTASLSDILTGRWPEMRVIRRRLFVQEWHFDRYTPDHVQKNLLDHNLGRGQPRNYRELLMGCLGALVTQYVDVRAGRPWILPDRFADWQRLLTWLAPLPILAQALWRNCPPRSWQAQDVEQHFHAVIAPAFAYSALPTTHDPVVEALIRRDRLTDLHIHLNGTTEVDGVWLDVLLHRRAFQKEIDDVGNKEAVLEQYSQIEEGLAPHAVAARIKIARRLRLLITDRLRELPLPPEIFDISQLVVDDPNALDVQERYDASHDLSQHPVRTLWAIEPQASELACEALWLMLAYEHIHKHDDEQMAQLLYAYLLILNATFLPLCVQQENQVGFDQFQKITLNGAREATEKEYARRFRQISFSQHGDVAVVEGRFAPKADGDRMAGLLRNILLGFAAFHGLPHGTYDPMRDAEVTRRHALDLRLVAHFIKDDELAGADTGMSVRFEQLRRRVAKQLNLLAELRDRYPGIAFYLTGIDAAANELHTPPEVFAPVYRAARRRGFVHFTYHVGEDFEHLVSGIRAVHEAVCFLDLRTGNRIGHGTALGIEPSLWLERSLAAIPKRKGDWLDDLVFAYHLLDGGSRYPQLHGRLESEIAKISQEIYGEAVSPVLLAQAWRMRDVDPFLVVAPGVDPTSLLDARERREEFDLMESAKAHPASFGMLVRYHSFEVVDRSREVILVDRDFFPAEALVKLQQEVIQEINRRGVAIECPPTSNLRISVYDDYHEHHLFRWLGLSRPEEPKPLVCLATDDPGIFATSMRNELIHIHRTLREHFGLTQPQAIAMLDALNRQGNSLVFAHGTDLFDSPIRPLAERPPEEAL